MEDEIQTQETEETETQESTPQKRSRRKSIRRRLDERLQQLDSLSRNPELKPTKQAEAAIEATAIEKMLFQAEREDRKDESLQDNETLKTQHESDIAEIARLKSQLETARSIKSQTVSTPDPDIPKLRQTIDILKSFIKFLASEFTGDPAKMAIAVILKFGKTAREYVTALGIDFDAYFSNLNSPQVMNEANLKASVNPPADEDLHTMLNRPAVGVDFAVAALAVVHQVDIKTPVRCVSGSNTRDYASLCPDVFKE